MSTARYFSHASQQATERCQATSVCSGARRVNSKSRHYSHASQQTTERCQATSLCSGARRVNSKSRHYSHRSQQTKRKIKTKHCQATPLWSGWISHRTRNNGAKLIVKHFNTSVAQHFYSIKITTTWNALPSEVVSSRTVNSFKNIFCKHWAENPPNVLVNW